jgi:purine nucleoside permease
MSAYKKSFFMILTLVLIGPAIFSAGSAAGAKAEVHSAEAIPVKVLILPKFEIDRMYGDLPGEAQYYYEHYLDGAESYNIPGGTEGSVLYIRDGVAMYVLGTGKVNAALSTMAVLSDARFDFSDAYILSTGCAGSAKGSTVMGDVFVISAAVDYDLGHHADIREMEDQTAETWFYDEDSAAAAVIRLNPELTDRVWETVKDLPMETTEKTRNFMSAAFDGAEWAIRDPKVLRGTAVTADNYWKGVYGHANALKMIQTYGCPDPYVTTEMEDNAVCAAARWMGMLDRLIVLRVSVNMDVFMNGETPESLWAPEYENRSDDYYEDNPEAADIFATAMKNNFTVGSAVIEAILAGDF